MLDVERQTLTCSLDEKFEVQFDGLGTVSKTGIVHSAIRILHLIDGEEVVVGVLSCLLILDSGVGMGG